MEFETIRYEVRNGVATITLNRPEVHNACNQQMGSELLQALQAAERSDEVRCVVLTGAGRAFCAGQDLKEVPAGPTTFFLDVLRERYPHSSARCASFPSRWWVLSTALLLVLGCRWRWQRISAS
jgi:enoyl-CoA hydratase/carnithine racemase